MPTNIAGSLAALFALAAAGFAIWGLVKEPVRPVLALVCSLLLAIAFLIEHFPH